MSDTLGTYYYQPENPRRFDDTWTGEPPAGTEQIDFRRLLANPPYATGTDYDAACGTGLFLVDAAKAVEEPCPQ